MLYFECYEQMIFDDDRLHYLDEEDAHDFIEGFFLKDNDHYPKIYKEEFKKDVKEDYEFCKENEILFRDFMARCFHAYGWRARLVECDREPYHIYKWSDYHEGWVMDRESEEVICPKCNTSINLGGQQ